MTFDLSITIPTFDRHDFLRVTLLALAPQIDAGVELVVVDNCSTPPVQSIVDEIFPTRGSNIKVVRNAVNIGLGANLLRCFEVASSDWLWVLSDDDSVMPDAVATIRATVKSHPNLLYGTFSMNVLPIAEDRIVGTEQDFFAELDSVPRLIFISTAIFNRRKLAGNLSDAYSYIPSGAPHVAAFMLAMGCVPKRGNFFEGLDSCSDRDGKPSFEDAAPPQNRASTDCVSDWSCGFFKTQIVEWKPPPVGHKYSSFTIVALAQLLDLCTQASARIDLANLLRTCVLSPSRLLPHALRDILEGGNRETIRLLCGEYLVMYGRIQRGVTASLLGVVYRFVFDLCLAMPHSSNRLLNAVSLLTKGRRPNLELAPVAITSYRRVMESFPRIGQTVCK
jgi:hypothetical protein